MEAVFPAAPQDHELGRCGRVTVSKARSGARRCRAGTEGGMDQTRAVLSPTPTRPWTRRGSSHPRHWSALRGHEALPRGRVPDARRLVIDPVATLDPWAPRTDHTGLGAPPVSEALPVAASQTRAVLSHDPVATLDPSGLQHTESRYRSAPQGHEALPVAGPRRAVLFTTRPRLEPVGAPATEYTYRSAPPGSRGTPRGRVPDARRLPPSVALGCRGSFSGAEGPPGSRHSPWPRPRRAPCADLRDLGPVGAPAPISRQGASGSRALPVAASQTRASSRPRRDLGPSGLRPHRVPPVRVPPHGGEDGSVGWIAGDQTRPVLSPDPSRPWTRRAPAPTDAEGALRGPRHPRGPRPGRAPSCRTTPSRPWTRRGSSTPSHPAVPLRVTRHSPWPRPRRAPSCPRPRPDPWTRRGSSTPTTLFWSALRVTRHSPVAASQTRALPSAPRRDLGPVGLQPPTT